MAEKRKFNTHFDGTTSLRSCEKEVIEPIVGKITGTIPFWLDGTLIRNGPGLFKIGDHEFKHVFDGMALLQKFTIKDEKVTFQCRFLQSDVYRANIKANRIVFTDFGTTSVPDPCQSIFQRFFSFFERKDPSDNTCVSLYPFGDELYSLSETPYMHKINKATLETEDKVDLRGLNIVHHSAHPHVTENGTVYSLAISKYGPKHCIVRFSNSKESQDGYSLYNRAEIVASIPVRWRLYPTYMHTFGITQNYFVLLEQPAVISLPSVIRNAFKNTPIIEYFKFFENELVQISVVSRKTGKIRYTFTSDTFFFFHTINHYEDENHIILDVCTFKNAEIINLTTEMLKDINNHSKYTDLFKSTPVRIVLPLIDSHDSIKQNDNLVTLKSTKAKAFLQENGTIHVQWEIITDIPCEMPTINYQKYSGVKYKYFYAISFEIDSIFPGSIIKVNIENQTVLRWYEDNCFANEPIFVPSPDAQDEDDGVILSNLVWNWEDTNRTGLLVLDAKSMKEIGRAEFKTPCAITSGLHGWFCST